MKQMEFTIMGQSYMLGCPEGGESALQEAVAAVDREMCAIRDAGKVKARERIAVLAALNLAYALAERPAAVPLPEVVPAPAETDGAETHGAESAELQALINRLDEALRHDDHLL